MAGHGARRRTTLGGLITERGAIDRQASGELDGYKGCWCDVSDLRIESVRADPGALIVSYTYSYDFKGDRRSEDVTLHLEKTGASFLISGAT